MKIRWERLTAALLAALCLLLALSACGQGGRREIHKVNWVTAPAYTAENAALPVETGNLAGCCTDGEFMYILVEQKPGEEEFPADLLRVSLAEGTAERLDGYKTRELQEEGFVNRLGPSLAPDGTLWIYEVYSVLHYDLPEDFDPERQDPGPYFAGRDDFHYLRQLDPATGREKDLIDLSDAARALNTAGFSDQTDFAVDSQGSLYLAHGGRVAVSDRRGNLLFTLEAGVFSSLIPYNSSGGALALLPDGTAGVLNTLPGGEQEVCVIDPKARGWGETRYALPGNVDLLYSGTGGFLFFYTQGGELYGWEPESETPRRLLIWTDTNLEGSVMCFAPLDGGRLAALTLQYAPPTEEGAVFYADQVGIVLLTPSDEDPNQGKAKLVYGAMLADSNLRSRISAFNRKSEDYIIELRDYAGMDASAFYALTSEDEARAVLDAADQRLRAEVAAGRPPRPLGFQPASGRLRPAGLSGGSVALD